MALSLLADRYLEQVKRLQKNSSIEHEFSLLLVPRRTLVCNKILEDAGVLGDVNIEEFPLYFIPLEQDVLSLELGDSFGDLYLVTSSSPVYSIELTDALQRKDPTCIFLAARALMLLQQKHGLFPRIIGKGDNAHRLMELLLRMRSEAVVEESSVPYRLGMMPSSTIESVIIIDREVDFATPLLTQLTYEGLIDELFTIKDNYTEVDVSIVGPGPGPNPSQTSLGKTPATPSPQGLKRKILLDSTDLLYDQLRDTNFATVGSLLNKVARRLESNYEARHGAKSTSELRDFVNKLPGYQAEQQSLKVHTSLAEEIMKQTFGSDIFTRILEVQQNLAAGSDPTSQHDTIEELIARDTPLPTVLRLLCLESCIGGGLRPKDLEKFKTLVLHAYGYQHLLTLDRLEKIQLLTSRAGGYLLGLPANPVGATQNPTRTNYNALRKPLRLIVDEVNESQPTDIAYVYSGYAPLSIRLVQCIIHKSYLLSLTKPSSLNNPQSAASMSSTSQGWQGFEDVLRAVKGETFNKVQKGEEAAAKARAVVQGSG